MKVAQTRTRKKRASPNAAISEERILAVIGLLEKGGTDEYAAAAAGVSSRTWYDVLNREPALAQRAKEAKKVADGKVISRLFDKAIAGDTIAMIFWLKNRDPNNWRDRHDYELSSQEGKPLEFKAFLSDGSALPASTQALSGNAAP